MFLNLIPPYYRVDVKQVDFEIDNGQRIVQSHSASDDLLTCQWIKIGDVKEVQISAQRQMIIDALEEEGRALRIADLARAADMKYNNTIQLTKRMLADGLIIKRESEALLSFRGSTLPVTFPPRSTVQLVHSSRISSSLCEM